MTLLLTNIFHGHLVERESLTEYILMQFKTEVVQTILTFNYMFPDMQ